MLLNPPGFFYAPRITEVVSITSTTSDTSSIAIPSDVRAGDLMILSNWCNILGAQNTSNPGSMTTAYSNSAVMTDGGGGISYRCKYRIADGGEGNGTLSVPNSPGRQTGSVLMVVRFNIPVTSATPTSFGRTVRNSDSLGNNSRTLNTSGATAPILCVVGYNGFFGFGTRGMTPTADHAQAGEDDIELRVKAMLTPESITNVSATLGSTFESTIVTGYFQLSGDT